MSTKISFFLNIIIVFLLSYTFSQASELKIIPLKKPILSDEILEKKMTQNIVDIQFELGIITISIDKNNSINMKGKVSEIKEINIKI